MEELERAEILYDYWRLVDMEERRPMTHREQKSDDQEMWDLRDEQPEPYPVKVNGVVRPMNEQELAALADPDGRDGA